MQSIYLVGSEDVRSAGNTMRSAAEDMLRAANTISEEIGRKIIADQDYLYQLAEILAEDRRKRGLDN